MNRRIVLPLAIALLVLTGPLTDYTSLTQAAEPSETFEIWPEGRAPGQTRVNGEEGLVEGRRRPFYQLTNISTPTVSVFLPPADKRTGAAVLACPGGGLQRLAYEHEALEIADWLNPLGITVFALKYRVPAPSQTGLMDAQRAMGLIRQRADEFQIDANRISVMGFSAGGEIAVMLATQFDGRAYETIDEADAISCRPTNVCLVYPGGIVRGGVLRPDIGGQLNRDTTPPMFVVHAFSDASENSLALAWELKEARVPSEIHIYQEGGHGFGARDTALPLNAWKGSYLAWLDSFGFFDKPYLGEYLASFTEALSGEGTLPRLTAEHPDATVEDGYAAQWQLVQPRLANDPRSGFKGGANTAAAQEAVGITHPLTGVLFRSGQIDDDGAAVVDFTGQPDMVVETEVGFLIADGVDISYRLNSIEHTMGAVGFIVPVIEFPVSYNRRMGTSPAAPDSLATNLGSHKFLIGRTRTNPDDIDLNSVQIVLQRDGQPLHDTVAGNVKGGQWGTLMELINQIVDHGYTLRGGDLIICGALPQPQPAVAGKYEADYGPLGSVSFELTTADE